MFVTQVQSSRAKTLWKNEWTPKNRGDAHCDQSNAKNIESGGGGPPGTSEPTTQEANLGLVGGAGEREWRCEKRQAPRLEGAEVEFIALSVVSWHHCGACMFTCVLCGDLPLGGASRF